MDIKEMMIGDWVSYKKIHNKIAPADFDDNHKKWREDIEPIPLTPEILEKNGFKLKEKAESYTEYVSGDEHSIITYVFYKESIYDVDTVLHCELGFVGGLNKIHHCHVKYVHQLQQAMRLCGINKTIEL